MSPESMRVAIADVCGFEGIHEEKHPAITYLWGYPRIGGQLCEEREMIPKYPNDLNACHEMEKVLRPADAYGEWKLWDQYVNILGENYTGSDDIAHASAKEKCEAFLRTLGKYTP